MPDLNSMRCSLLVGPDDTALPEHHITYGNQRVQCSVAIPSNDVSFSLHFTTIGYVGPGVAIFVFIDGQYQANRNKTGLSSSHRTTSAEKPAVDFRIRQKEEWDKHGKFIVGREWRFGSLQYAKNDEDTALNESFLANLGTIEVVVLRCEAGSLAAVHDATDVGPPTSSRSPGKSPHSPFQFDGPSEEEALPNFEGAWGGRSRNNKGGSQRTASQAPVWGVDGGDDDAWGQPANDGNQQPAWGQEATPSVKSSNKGVQAVEGEVSYADWKKSQARRTRTATPTFGPVPDQVASADTAVKSYWKDWSTPSRGYGMEGGGSQSQRTSIPKDPTISPAYQLPEVCKTYAKSRGLRHQAMTSYGARYSYPQARPVYIDTMQTPFAVFTFHYRSGAASKTHGAASKHAQTKVPSTVPSSRKSSSKAQSVHQSVANWNDGNQQAEVQNTGGWGTTEQAGGWGTADAAGAWGAPGEDESKEKVQEKVEKKGDDKTAAETQW